MSVMKKLNGVKEKLEERKKDKALMKEVKGHLPKDASKEQIDEAFQAAKNMAKDAELMEEVIAHSPSDAKKEDILNLYKHVKEREKE